MPAKTCASCSKSVFPMEELKCLDKTWHKGCFKCQVCNMTLNMKNYRGYHKLPYCNAHYPETKFTAVADTPESRRLAQNSKQQSNIAYHAEFEKEKGQYTSVADDPETLRVKKNMETISNVSYHGDVARRQEMENTRPNEYEPSDAPPRSYTAPPTSYTALPSQSQQHRLPSTSSQGYPSQQPAAPVPQQGYGRRPGSINDYDPATGATHTNSPYSSKPQSTTVYNSQQNAPQAYGSRLPSSSSEPAAPYSQRSQGQGQPPQHRQSGFSYGQPAAQSYSAQSQSSSQQQQVYRPPHNTAAMAPPSQQQQPMRQPQQQPPPQRSMAPPQQQRAPQQPASRDPYYGKGKVSKSLYDYAAADEDEISFREDDIIIKCEPIDDGWMTGTVERTGQHGMLPSNYVEHLNW